MDPILGQICLFGFNFVPRGWAACNGQLLPISQNTALFALLSTQYGGDGQSTFALPDLRGRVPLGPGQGPGLNPYNVGDQGGNQSVTITSAQMPAHNHTLTGSGNAATTSTLSGNVLASSNGVTASEDSVTVNTYGPAGGPVTADPSAIGASGNGQPLGIMPPYLCLNYCIATEGIFPSRS